LKTKGIGGWRSTKLVLSQSKWGGGRQRRKKPDVRLSTRPGGRTPLLTKRERNKNKKGGGKTKKKKKNTAPFYPSAQNR